MGCGIEHGNGAFIENGGDSYAGKLRRDKRSGPGTPYLKVGGYYYGNFENDNGSYAEFIAYVRKHEKIMANN